MRHVWTRFAHRWIRTLKYQKFNVLQLRFLFSPRKFHCWLSLINTQWCTCLWHGISLWYCNLQDTVSSNVRLKNLIVLMTLRLVAIFLNQEAALSLLPFSCKRRKWMCWCLGGLYGLFADLVWRYAAAIRYEVLPSSVDLCTRFRCHASWMPCINFAFTA